MSVNPPIPPSAWKVNSANFAFSEFSELRIAPVRHKGLCPRR